MRLIAQIAAAFRDFRSPSHRRAPARTERPLHMNATRAPFTLISAHNRNPRWPRCALPAALLSGSSRKIEARPFRAVQLPLKYQLCRASPSRNGQSSEICPRKQHIQVNGARAAFTLRSARLRNPPDGRAAPSLCGALLAALFSGSSYKIEARPFRAARLPLKYQLCLA